jgi:methylmalonyl-CoA/ethylmalonyl-CoA epimerase
MDHVALLVASVETVLARLGTLGLSVGPVEEFPADGTREAYVGAPECRGRLLLMQPLGAEGPYARALAARGPGLHHVAINVTALEEHVAHVRGWLLHPTSLESVAKHRTAWLARPGVGTLLEIRETAPVVGQPIVQALEVPVEPGLEPLLEPYGLIPSHDRRAHLVLAGRRFEATQLAG